MNKKISIIVSVGLLVIIVGIIVMGLFLQKPGENDLTKEQQESMLLGGEEADNLARKELKQYPILEWIPYIEDKYSDDMTVYTHYEIWPAYEGDSMTVVIKDYTGGNEQVAKDKIKSWGMKLEDYEIKYENLSSEYGSVRVSDD